MSHSKKSSFASIRQLSPRSPSIRTPGNSHFFLSPSDLYKTSEPEEDKYSERGVDSRNSQILSETASDIQKKASQIEILMNKFLNSHTLGDIFPPNQRLAVFSDKLNLLDFIKLYTEQPVQHPNANCEACLIFSETELDFIAAISLQDVENMVLYFFSAARKAKQSEGSIEEQKDPDQSILLQDQKKGFSLYYQSREEALIQIKRLSQRSFEESKQLLSKLVHKHTTQHNELNDFTRADQTIMYLQLRIVTLRDWIAFYTDTLGELQSKISLLQPQTSLLDASSPLQGTNIKQAVIIDKNGNPCGILSRLSILSYIQ